MFFPLAFCQATPRDVKMKINERVTYPANGVEVEGIGVRMQLLSTVGTDDVSASRSRKYDDRVIFPRAPSKNTCHMTPRDSLAVSTHVRTTTCVLR